MIGKNREERLLNFHTRAKITALNKTENIFATTESQR